MANLLYHFDCNPIIDIYAHFRVGFPPLFYEATYKPIQNSLRIRTKEALDLTYKEIEVMDLI